LKKISYEMKKGNFTILERYMHTHRQSVEKFRQETLRNQGKEKVERFKVKRNHRMSKILNWGNELGGFLKDVDFLPFLPRR